MNALKKMLGFADTNKDSIITPAEFVQYVKTLNPLASAEQIKRLFAQMDVNEDTTITLSDDIDGNGRLDRQDVLTRQILGQERYAYMPSILQELAAEFQQYKHIISHKEQTITQTTYLHEGLRVYKHTVPINGLHEPLEGITLLHISDIHLGKRTHKQLNMLRAIATIPESIDIVACTGDIVHDSIDAFTQQAQDVLSSIFPNAARYMVLGNHDHRAGGEEVAAMMKQLGYIDLTNSTATYTRGESSLQFYGLDDATRGKPTLSLPARPSKHNILLAHNLDVLRLSTPHFFDLTLSGHLHAGEINLCIINGIDYLKHIGSYDNINEHVVDFSALSHRTLSYISPGLASTFGIRLGVKKEGVSIHTLTAYTPPADMLK